MITARIPDEYGPYLRIGTCSWKFDSWKGLLYESEKRYRPQDYLRDYISPKPEAVRAAARIVRANARRRVLTYVNVNNHLEGSAPLTIQRLLEALANEKSY